MNKLSLATVAAVLFVASACTTKSSVQEPQEALPSTEISQEVSDVQPSTESGDLAQTESTPEPEQASQPVESLGASSSGLGR